MKISCKIIEDLLPLYHDDVCSNESRTVVEEHLLECDDCKKNLESMNSDFILNDTEKATEQAKFDTLRGVRKKLFQKNVIISVVSVFCAIGVLLGGFSFVFHYRIPISYEAGLLSVDKADDGVIDIIFNGDDYYSSYGLNKTIEIDGVEQNFAYIYYTDNIWTKYFSKPATNDEVYQFSIGNSIMIDYGKNREAIQSEKDITAVYYQIGDYRDLIQMSDEEFLKATQDAILIWEK